MEEGKTKTPRQVANGGLTKPDKAKWMPVWATLLTLLYQIEFFRPFDGCPAIVGIKFTINVLRNGLTILFLLLHHLSTLDLHFCTMND
jgi:hypothetical protein